MRAYDIICKKRDKEELTFEELDFMINGYINQKVPDYQVSALLMAIYLNGMTKKELFSLTKLMTDSGEILDLSSIEGVTIDKHSTGGVGDTTTLIIGPILAACGIPCAKMSGRGLGHTGGTLDKLEAIPGFNVFVRKEDFIQQVNKIKLCICGQTANIAPADKLLYALRDVTGTVESIPLIASSIMSKKLAVSCDKIILDVKVGSGAFMKDIDQAEMLAKLMVEIGTDAGKETIALITNMDEPLGASIGNTIEVSEVIEMLKGEKEGPLLDLSKYISSIALELTGIYSKQEARKKIEEVLASGEAFNAFCEMVQWQKGDVQCVRSSNLPQSKGVFVFKAEKNGWISKIDALKIGEAALVLGAGREKKEDSIQSEVGIELLVRVGCEVKSGQAIAKIHYNDENSIILSTEHLKRAFSYSENRIEHNPLIYKIVTKDKIIKYQGK